MSGATGGITWRSKIEHRLVLSVVPGKRTAGNAVSVVADAARRMGGRTPRLVTTDEHGPYEQAVLDAFGVDVTPPRTGKPGRPRKARREPHPDLTYATVRKARAKGRVASVVTTLAFGTAATLATAVGRSSCGTHVNTSFVERLNGPTGTATRGRPARPTGSARTARRTTRPAPSRRTATPSAGPDGRWRRRAWAAGPGPERRPWRPA